MEEAMFEHLFQKYKDMIYRVAFIFIKKYADGFYIFKKKIIKIIKKNYF